MNPRLNMGSKTLWMLWLAAFISFISLAWILNSFWRQSLLWQPAGGFYQTEMYDNHRYFWLQSPAELTVHADQAAVCNISAAWRCGFHKQNATLEIFLNGEQIHKATIGQKLKTIAISNVHFKAGSNSIRIVSDAGNVRISQKDPRTVAVGMQDFSANQLTPPLDEGYAVFFAGFSALCLFGIRISRFAGEDSQARLSAGLLASFCALSLSATCLSAVHGLNGTSWTLVLGAMALCPFWQRKTQPASIPQESLLSKWQIGVLLLPAVIMGGIQLMSPVTKYDDLMYHGSRAGYWLWNQSVFPFPTHNERQEVFPYSGDLIFAFGVLTAKSEVLGRLLVFLAYPATLLFAANILRKRKVSPALAIGAAWIAGSFPQTLDAAIGIKPDLWGTVFLLICFDSAWTLLGETSRRNQIVHSILLPGAITAAIAIKFTFLLLLPLGLLPFLKARDWAQRGIVAGSFLAFSLALGLVWTCVHNKLYEGGWLGSPAMADVHQPEPGLQTRVRQMSRLPFLFVGIPWLPEEHLRSYVNEGLFWVASHTGALKPLPLEEPEGWPGRFQPSVSEYDRGYSLLWLFVIMGLATGTAVYMRSNNRSEFKGAILGVVIGVGLIVGITCKVRWQENSIIPIRFLVPGAAVLILSAVWFWDQGRHKGKVTIIAFFLLIAVHGIPFFHTCWSFYSAQLDHGFSYVAQAESVLSPAAGVIPAGSKVLLFSSQSSGDYVLFHANQGFSTYLCTWGRASFSPSSFAQVLDRFQPDFIVFEDAQHLNLHWHGVLDTRPFINYLGNSSAYFQFPGAEPILIYRRNEPQINPQRMPSLISWVQTYIRNQTNLPPTVPQTPQL